MSPPTGKPRLISWSLVRLFYPFFPNTRADISFRLIVTDPNGRIPRSIPPAHPVPRTASEFAEYFRNHQLGEENREDMRNFYSEHVGKSEKVASYRKSVLLEHAQHVRNGSPFTVSLPMQVSINTMLRLLRHGDLMDCDNLGKSTHGPPFPNPQGTMGDCSH
jgi:hypothetical protein